MVGFNHKMDERSTGLDDLEVFFLDNKAIYSTATRLSSTFLFIFVLHRKKNYGCRCPFVERMSPLAHNRSMNTNDPWIIGLLYISDMLNRNQLYTI